MPEIIVDTLTHTFGIGTPNALTVLEDINLTFESGSFNAIVGTSGCGKSTLLKMMAGLIEPSDGQMTLDGDVIKGTDQRRGMVFQQDAVFPWMTVAKNVSYGARLRGASKAEQAEIESKWVDMVGLKGFEDRWPRELSGGMRKRVDIGRVYANDPDVLLMDEPFGALDAQTKERMQSDLLTTWNQSKKTVVFVTHDLEEAIFLADRIIVMSARPDQLNRISAKLNQARDRDPNLQVFGASSHKYEIGPPLEETAILAFERQHKVSLPLDYVAFLTTIGHGSPRDGRAAAGPFYGIDPLERAQAIMGGTTSLSMPPVIHPDMSDEDWAEETKRLSLDEDELSDEAFDREQGRIYAGLLTLGHQGCESYQAILLDGPHKGRVINIDTDGHKPKFAYEDTFLDWYERWLDEIISGGLLQPHTGWFGYTMGGDDTELMQVYHAADDERTKLDAVRGLMKHAQIEPQTCDRLDALCENETDRGGQPISGIIGRFDNAIFALKRHGAEYGAEYLIARDRKRWIDIPQHSRRIEISAITLLIATNLHFDTKTTGITHHATDML
eukprot:g17689.t1